MIDTPLTVPDQKEALSRAYVRAVAARAGFATADPDFDRDGVDLRIQAGGAMRPALDLQLKATVNLGEPHGGNFRFPLNRRNYELLRIETQTPRLLVVFNMPRDQSEWMAITTTELVLRHCAYWLSLKGCEETDNRSSVTVRIPSNNLFDVNGLHALMKQSRKGGVQ